MEPRTEADELMERLPNIKERMKRADPELYELCQDTETNLFEEFATAHFVEYMVHIVFPLNGGSERLPVPLPEGNIPLEGLTIGDESFTKQEIEQLIRVSQWRFTTSD